MLSGLKLQAAHMECGIIGFVNLIMQHFEFHLPDTEVTLQFLC